MISWDNSIINAIARRRCVIVLGAGVSRNSTNAKGKRPDTWEDFLKNCVSNLTDVDHINTLISQKDFLTACELIKERMGADDFTEKVQQEYQRSGYRHASIHEQIYKLDSSIVASPNFDNIYDTYASSESASSVVIKDHTSSDIANYLLGGDKRLIIKTHGSANNPTEIIFTRNDYAEARTKYVLFYEILKSLALTHTFLFLGCGTDDPDIRQLFEDLQFTHGRMPYHYMTLPKGEVHNDVLEVASASMRIKFVEYSSDNGHEELSLSLADLVTDVEGVRFELTRNGQW
ncbi:hypothetical protein ABA45_07740 [Marinobacter psychrophilus]|uniref:Uncharacterized protein n=1 Tax=Marinobacter psychrophilus TaxID=330734 RepID=A0A0H4I3G8_9GAMM|nr:SIR2 family protein [Marinobacter psychrophilus]AKO52328.1 hypothetical protein ABA45_07740 [Marinobacter psychrophilus]